MPIIQINSLNDKGIEMFCSLTEAQLRNKLEPEKGIFIVESPKVIRIAIEQGFQPIAILTERKHITGDAADIISQLDKSVPIYTGERELLAAITGYKLTRGVLCAMQRPVEKSVDTIIKNAHRVVVIDNVVDTTNIGAIFRSAAALGIDAVLLTRNSCDPLNRRSVRVSMGTVFLIPWTWIDDINLLKEKEFKTVAMALTDKSISIDAPSLQHEEKLAIIMGTEGDGLPQATIEQADYTVRIPMMNGVDSLNVAAASAIAFWQLRKNKNLTNPQ